MKNVIYKPFAPHGEVSVPPSKSDVHRAVICAMLSGGICKISPVALSNDINATIDCARALGAKIELENDILTVDGTEVFKNKTAVLDCGESGSTLRFFVPVAAAGGAGAHRRRPGVGGGGRGCGLNGRGPRRPSCPPRPGKPAARRERPA